MNILDKSQKQIINTPQKSNKWKIHKRIIFIVMSVIAPINTAISQVPPCTPYPLCLTTPQQAAINTINNLPSRISSNRFVQGGFTPGLRSRISPILDTTFPLFPFQNNNSGFGLANSFNPSFYGGFAGKGTFAPINFQAIDYIYRNLFNTGFNQLGF